MSALTDINSLLTSLQTYWNSLGLYLNNNGSAPTYTYMSGVTYGDLSTQIEQTFDSNVGLTQGGLLERADAYNGYARDISLRSTTKAQYYQAALTELTQMSELEAAEVAVASTYVLGQSPFQSYTLS